MEKASTLGDIGAELEGLQNVLTIIAMFVKPDEEASLKGSTATGEGLDFAFFSVESTLKRLAEEVNEWEVKYMELERKWNKLNEWSRLHL